MGVSQMGNESDEEKDRKLFAELDSHSKNLRASTKVFADSLDITQNKTEDLQQLIQALRKIETGKIDEIDEALENFKKAFAAITMNSNGAEMFGPAVKTEQLPGLLEKYSAFMKELMIFVGKANDLENGNG